MSGMDHGVAARPVAARSRAILDAVSEIAAAIRQASASTIAGLAVDRARGLVGADGAVVYSWDDSARCLVPLYESASNTRASNLRPGQGMVGLAFESGHAVTSPDYRSWPGALRQSSARGMRAAAAVPLTIDGHAVGALGVWRDEPGEFESDALDLLTLFASLVAPVLEATRAAEAGEERLEVMSALNEIGRATAAVQNPAEICAMLIASAGELLGGVACAVALIDEREPTEGLCLPGPGFEMESARALELARLALDADAPIVEPGIIAVPLQSAANRLGALVVHQTDQDADRHLLELLTFAGGGQPSLRGPQ